MSALLAPDPKTPSSTAAGSKTPSPETRRVASTPDGTPDGHTLLVSGASSFTVVPALRDKLPFDVLKDLAPVALVTYTPLVLVTASTKPYRQLSDLLAAAKDRPKALPHSTHGGLRLGRDANRRGLSVRERLHAGCLSRASRDPL